MTPDIIVLAQATAPTVKSAAPVVTAPFPIVQTPSTGASVAKAQIPTTQVREIQAIDIFEKLGLTAIVDVVAITVLAVICAAILTGVLLFFMRKSFGSAADAKILADGAEKQWFDLVTRKERGEGKAIGLNRQVAALEAAIIKAGG